MRVAGIEGGLIGEPLIDPDVKLVAGVDPNARARPVVVGAVYSRDRVPLAIDPDIGLGIILDHLDRHGINQVARPGRELVRRALQVGITWALISGQAVERDEGLEHASGSGHVDTGIGVPKLRTWEEIPIFVTGPGTVWIHLKALTVWVELPPI